ncbi:MAG: hypothetical protein KIT26_12565 [Nitrosomonas sp.]|nr:hypothetical protein [Nitrosomonas sp.]
MKLEALPKFIEDARGYLNGNVTIESLTESYEPVEAFCHFWHFLTDEDIRTKDSVYKEMQETELKLFLRFVEAGDYAAAEQTTFLGSQSEKRGLFKW